MTPLTTDQRSPERTLPLHREPPTPEGNVEVFTVPDSPVAPPPAPRGEPGPPDRRSKPRVPDTDRRRTPRSPRAQLFVTVCHWAMAALLTVNLLSGMRIGWGYSESPLGGPSGAWGSLLAKISPTGTMLGVNLMTLHVMLSFLMLLVAGVYLGYLLWSRSSRRFQVTRRDLRSLWAGIRTRQFWRDKAALWSANLLTYWMSFFFIATLVVTGIALYRLDWGLSTVFGGYTATRVLHAAIAYLLIPFVVLHSVLQWFFRRFWTIFKIQLSRRHVWAGLASLTLVLPVVAAAYLANAIATTLTVKRIAADQAPRLDGDGSKPVWRQAQAVTIRTTKGVNNPHDYVDIDVKAVHDGTHVYFLFAWSDPDVSYKRYPLIKTAQGWKMLQTAFAAADENVYYEDKLSAYFTDVPNRSCAATCHLGVGPHAEKGQKHGVHYTNGEVGDVWHWKSVRSDPNGAPKGEPGWVHDQHFRAADPPSTLKPGQRYSAGYHADPGTGGYSYNFEKVDPTKPISELYLRPKMLPARPVVITNADPATSEQGATWWIHKSEGIPYTPQADGYPVGALIPNIIIEPFQGDHADVRGQGAWRQGRWTVEMKRLLDTGSKFDVAFNSKRPVYMSVAAYNRTQTRHSEHIVPIRVALQP